MPIRDKVYNKLKSLGLTDSKEDFFNYYDNDENVRKDVYRRLREDGLRNSEEEFYSAMKPKSSSEDDAAFEANAERFRNGQPTEKVTTQSMIDAHPELGLGEQPSQKPSVTEQYILDNRPDMFGKRNASLMDAPLHLGNNRPEPFYEPQSIYNTLNDAYGAANDYTKRVNARAEIAERTLKDPIVQKGRTEADMRGLSSEIDDLLEKENQEQQNTFVSFAGMPAGARGRAYRQANEERSDNVSNLWAAKRLLEQSNYIVEAAKRGDTGILSDTWQGFKDSLEAEDFTFGLADAASSAAILDAIKKVEKGEQLTEAEDKLLRASAINMAVQYNFAKDLGRAYKAGETFGESVPFMLEMAINPISSFGKASAKTLLNYGLKAYAKQVGKGLAKGVAAGTGMALTTGAGRVAAGTTDRLASNYNYGVDFDGNLYAEKKDDAMSVGEAFARSLASTVIENQSEMIFNAFKGVGGFMKGVQDVLPGGVNKFFDMLTNNKVADAYRWLKNSKVFRNYLVKDLRNATNIGGLGEEYLEEVYNNLANFAIGEMSWDDVVSLDKNIDTLLGLAPTQAMFGLLGLGGAGAMRYQTRRTLEDLQATMNEQQRKQLEGLLDMGLDAEEVDVRGFIRNVMQNEGYTIDNKRDMIKAAFYVAKQKGIDQLAEADVIDKVNAENAIIDSVTDPSTGLYSEITAKLPDAKGGTAEVPGYVVGWFGEGEKRQPVFVAEGMDNTYENRRVLKPGEWDAASVQEMPAEEVKAVNEEMIREEAAVQAEQESKYAPEVLSAQMQQGVPFNTPNAQIVPVSPMPEGNGWIVEEYPMDTNNKVAKQPIIRELSNDEYRNMLQAQLDAQEMAVQQVVAEEQTLTEEAAPQPEAVSEVQSEAIGSNMTPVQEVEQPQEPLIPTKEDGSVDFVAYGKEGSFKALGEKYGEKMPNKVAVTAKALAGDLKKAQDKLAKAEEAYDNAPIGREQKAEQARDKARQELEAIQREADFWAEMDADIKSAQQRREEILNPQAEVEASNEPMTADEFVAQQLAAGNIVLNKDDYMRETGFGSEEANAMNGGARKLLGVNGMTIQEAGERLMEMDRENGTNFFDQSDSNAGRDALISVLGSVKSRKELNQYIAGNRKAQAEKASEGLRNELEKQVMEANYASLEDYVLQMEAAETENPFMEDRADEIMAIFAEEAAKYEQSLNNTENGQGTTNEVAEGGDTVLSEEQSDDTGGTEERSESERVGNGIADEGEAAHAGEQASEVELKQQEGETILQFAERIAEENRRKPLRERANDWSKKLGVKVKLMESLDDVTNPSAKRAIASGQMVTGWFEESTGEVCLYMPNIASESEVDATYIHEVVAHKGLRGLLGDKFDSFCDEVWDMMSNDDRLEFMDYPGVSHLEGKEKSRAAADEYIAHLAENIDVTESAWGKFTELIKRFLKAIGIEPKMTNADIANTIKKSYQRLLSGENTEGNASGEGTRFNAKKKASKTVLPEDESSFKGSVVSDADRTKVLNNLDILQKEYEEKSIIDKAKSDGTYMKAPNGEPTNLNEKQWAQVRTGAFKKWFGDWENEPEKASKIVDENGEPMVVYHGSDSDFNVFDKTRGRANMDIQGMFFSPWDDDARGYGFNVRAFYLNIKNPANESTGYKALKKFQGQNGAGIKAREYLVSVGYDGVNNEDQEFIAFESNQIKSATDNVGTFDGENNDIRFRFIGERGARNLDKAEEATTRLDNLSVAREMEAAFNAKKERIEKLKDSEPIVAEWKDYEGRYELNNRSAADYINNELRGEYTNKDTGNQIKITRKGAFKVTRHDAESDVHLKSIALIPQMIEEAIFIEELPNLKGGTGFDSYRYYVVGLKLDGVDYTAKLAVGTKNGETYYDHSLTEIEKTNLIERRDEISSSFTDNEAVNPYHKDRRLISILQTNDKENAKKIKMATGWERGADGKWRYEVKDHFDIDAMERFVRVAYGKTFGAKVPLERVLKNDDTLLTEYPQLKDISVRFQRLGNSWGVYYPKSNEIAINTNFIREEREISDRLERQKELVEQWRKPEESKKVMDMIKVFELNPEEVLKDAEEKLVGIEGELEFFKNQMRERLETTIIHEVQHAIQHIEGFENGGSIDSAKKEAAVLIKEIGLPSNTTLGMLKQGFDEGYATNEQVEKAKKMAESRGFKDVKSYIDSLGLERFYNRMSGEVEARNAARRSNSMSKDDMREYLASETEDVAREDQIFLQGAIDSAQNTARFRIANRNQEIFVSNAQRAVEGIKQEKATPQQWLAMIEKNGGLKAGEDKWLGLSDWLKDSDKKSLTKAEIFDYIYQNKIVIEEVKYSEMANNNGLDKAILDARGIEFRDSFMDAFGFDSYGEAWLSNEEEAVRLYNENNEIQIELDEYGHVDERNEIKLTDWAQRVASEVGSNQINSTRLNYTTKGLENKQEIALTVPTIEPWNLDDKIHFGDAGEGRAVAWIRFGETTGYDAELEKAVRDADNAVVAFQNSMAEKYLPDGGSGDASEYIDYMSEDEVKQMRELIDAHMLAQIKSEKNKKRVLVIDEIQSKRHQEGREHGYRSNSVVKQLESLMKVANEKNNDYFARLKELKSEFGLYTISEEVENDWRNSDKELAKRYEARKEAGTALADFRKAHENELKRDAVPEAPFEKNWHELAMKRMLRYAAENSFDKVAWTKGAQQAERYNIGGVVDSIEYFLRGDGSYRVETYGKHGYQISSIPTEFKDGQALAEVFGKELATKMVKDLEEDRVKEEEARKSKKEIRDKMRGMDEDSAEYEALLSEFSKFDSIQDKVNEGHIISGDGLRIGGEGMKGFYDKMLPSFVNKYVKKWGTKVQDIELPNVEEAGRFMHSVDVTEAMKESVMEGQTMFRISDKGRQIQSEVDKFASKYNSKEVVLVDSEMTDEELEAAIPGGSADDIRESLKTENCMGGYLPDTDKIYIFVDNHPIDDVEGTMFHENAHGMFHNNVIIDAFDKASKDAFKAAREAIAEEYAENHRAEELFAYVVQKAMNEGDFKHIEKYLAGDYKKEFYNKLNDFGYDTEKEIGRRNLGRRTGEKSQGVRTEGSGKQESDGKAVRKKEPDTREQAERLRTLFGQVADMGLDGVLGNKEYTRLMVDIYKELPQDVRTSLADDVLRHYKGSIAPAVSDYLNHNAEASIWDKVVGIIREALRKVGFDVDLNTNDVKYILWRSRKPLDRNNLVEVAEDIDMRYRLKVGEYNSSPTDGGDTPGGDGTRFRVDVGNKLNIRDQYEATIKKGGYQAREAVQDNMLSLRRVQELIEKESGKKLRDFENAWMHENRLSSVVQSAIHEMERKFYKPMTEAVKKLMKAAGLEQEQVADYLMLKHAIERNREMAVRKALTDSEGKIDRKRLEDWYRDKRNVRNRQATPHLDTWRKQQKELDNIALLYGADMSRDYSGLTSMFDTDDLADCTERAYNEVKALENAHPNETEALGKAIKAMTHNTLDESFGSGLMNKAVYDELSNDMYDYYIPLRGFEETTSDEVYAYMDNDRGAFNAPLVRAKGRSSKADNPLAYLKSIAESGIMQGERNKMKQTFLNMVINNPSDLVSVREGVWAIFNPASGEWEAASFPESKVPRNATPADVQAAYEQWEADMEQRAQQGPNVKKISEADDVPYRVIGNRMNQHQVIVKRLGKSYTLTINGNPRLAMALNGLTNPYNTSNDGKVSAYVQNKVDMINRNLSAWYTTRNPDFVASNFMRDTFYTNTIVRAKEGNHYANHFHAHYAKLVMPGRMLNLFRKYENGTLDLSKPMERDFHEFMVNGGETGYSNLKDLEHIKKQIAKDVKGGRWEDVETLLDSLDLINRAVENVARFAAYRTSRQQGRSVARAIFDAKEISVNFNKKGAGGTFFGATGQTGFGNLAAMVGAGGRAFYVFFNAAIQGTTNLLHVTKKNPVGAGVGLGAMFLMGALVPMLLGGDDEKDYYDLPEHVRRNHLILPGAGDAWVSIPLPIEYRIMYGMGELLTSWRTGHERGLNIGMKMLSLTGQALPLNFLEEGVDAFMPSALSPLWQVYNNQSWTGLPIYKDNEFNKDNPEYTKAYKNVDRGLYKFTKALYNWTFDEENQKEGIDLNPAVIEHIAKGYFGGLVTTLSNVIKTEEMIAGEREFDWRNIPIGNRIFKSGDERTKEKRIQNEYFENVDKLEFMQSRERFLRKTKDGAGVPEADKREADEDYRIMLGSGVYKKYITDPNSFKAKKKAADRIYRQRKEKDSEKLEKDYYKALEEANKAVR